VPSIPRRAGLIALALTGLALAPAAHADGKHNTERLVVRGDSTVVDVPCGPGVICIELKNATFRGTPVGTGAYTGAIKLKVAEAFPNGEGGVCAPLEGKITLGTGTPNRLVLAVEGDSCQDGAGDPTTTAFTGLARFSVKHGTGIYSRAHGGGIAVFAEDAADHDRMTLMAQIGR
jgi:hypothetical protein